MKKLLIFALVTVLITFVHTSCKFAPKEELGDTVAASVFEPYDTTMAGRRKAGQDTLLKARMKNTKDSADLFFIGPESNAQALQLLSYPSRRDTTSFSKGRHLKVTGNADIGRVVRVKFYTLPSGDSIVTRIEEIKQ